MDEEKRRALKDELAGAPTLTRDAAIRWTHALALALKHSGYNFVIHVDFGENDLTTIFMSENSLVSDEFRSAAMALSPEVASSFTPVPEVPGSLN